LEAMGTNCTKQRKKFEAVLRIIFEVLSNHLVRERINNKMVRKDVLENKISNKSNLVIVFLPQECTGKQPQIYEAHPQAFPLCISVKF